MSKNGNVVRLTPAQFNAKRGGPVIIVQGPFGITYTQTLKYAR